MKRRAANVLTFVQKGEPEADQAMRSTKASVGNRGLLEIIFPRQTSSRISGGALHGHALATAVAPLDQANKHTGAFVTGLSCGGKFQAGLYAGCAAVPRKRCCDSEIEAPRWRRRCRSRRCSALSNVIWGLETQARIERGALVISQEGPMGRRERSVVGHGRYAIQGQRTGHRAVWVSRGH